MKINQRKLIIDYLNDGHTLTSLAALRHFGIARLAARISELRSAGYNIESEMLTRKNMYGVRIHYAKYFLSQDAIK
ncbi:MAG: helix-turn-helix domain-containing protein [Clostridia bacterium]